MFKLLRLTLKFILVGGLLLLPAAAGTKTAFTVGDTYTFYCDSASSQARTVTCSPAYAPIYKYILSSSLTGESTVYKTASAAETAETEEIAEITPSTIMESFDAELLFSETACGVVNYYCYSPLLGEGVSLGGYLVNLHVAQSQTSTAVGTPLIFGGF